MKMMKIAASAAIRHAIATLPFEGSCQPIPARKLSCSATVMSCAPSFVMPVGIFGVLQIPERAPALHHRDRGKVVFGGRRGGRPLERPGIPGIAARAWPSEIRPD